MRFHRLDLNHLVTLEVLLTERSLTRAAERLNVTQPGISNALTTLRRHFDDELLVRRGREMECTPFALSILQPLGETLRQLRGIALAKPGFNPSVAERTYRVVAPDYIASVFLSEAPLHIAEIAPNVTISQVPMGEDALAQFAHSEVDAVIFPDGKPVMASKPKQPLFREGFVCIARRNNPNVPDRISMEDYFGLPRVNPPYKEFWVDSHLKRPEGMTIRPAVSLRFSAIPLFVSRSDYIALIPERLLGQYERLVPVRRVALEQALPQVQFVMQWQPEAMSDPFHVWLVEQFQQLGRKLDEVARRGEISCRAFQYRPRAIARAPAHGSRGGCGWHLRRWPRSAAQRPTRRSSRSTSICRSIRWRRASGSRSVTIIARASSSPTTPSIRRRTSSA